MLVGPMMTDSRTLFDLNDTEFFKDRVDDVLQDEKLIHEHDFVPVKITEGPFSYVDILEI
jgi:hypothetical protein